MSLMRGKILAEALDGLEVFAGLDFDFDALVTGLEFLSDGGGKFVERIFDTDGNAAWNFLLLAAD